MGTSTKEGTWPTDYNPTSADIPPRSCELTSQHDTDSQAVISRVPAAAHTGSHVLVFLTKTPGSTIPSPFRGPAESRLLAAIKHRLCLGHDIVPTLEELSLVHRLGETVRHHVIRASKKDLDPVEEA